MSKQKISLNDRLDLTKSPVLLNGTQALVRLMLMQKARDRAAGQSGDLPSMSPDPAGQGSKREREP